MTIEERIEAIKKARALVADAVDGCGMPMLETTLGEADMNLHWALWNLGEPVSLRHENESL